MIIDTAKNYESRLRAPHKLPSPNPKTVLLVKPDHFEIRYAINVHMTQSDGTLQRVNSLRAKAQWQDLRSKYEQLKVPVQVLESLSDLPDMVFAANTSFVWWDAEKKIKRALLSQMASEQRAGEVVAMKRWYDDHNYQVDALSNKALKFEGTGDALWIAGRNLVIGGWGYRSDKAVYTEISERFGLDVIRLQLVKPECYHLDTALAVLNDETAVVDLSAFTSEGAGLLRSVFKTLISVSPSENSKYFVCNLHCPNGKDILMHPGATEIERKLAALGFEVHRVEVSEFIKAGGAVFCMKMQVY